ncbi:MAG: hypothetical protein WCJ35_24570 [Planctomycetota bacterium]
MSIIDRDLKDSHSPGLSADWKMAIAYNAALHVALVGLAAEGYRVARESHHYRAIQSFAFTLRCNSKLIAQVDAFRKKRNISDYERAGSVSDREVEEMHTLATELHSQLLDWLRNTHPELILSQD